jgi:hypothetical protein
VAASADSMSVPAAGACLPRREERIPGLGRMNITIHTSVFIQSVFRLIKMLSVFTIQTLQKQKRARVIVTKLKELSEACWHYNQK